MRDIANISTDDKRVLFLNTAAKKKLHPSIVEKDYPFYSDANMNHLKNIIDDIESGKAKLKEHELIED